MQQQVLFLQGGGDDGYEADKKMVSSLRSALGDDYVVDYPRLASDESRTDFGWPQQIGDLIQRSKGPLIVVAHSVGASLLLKYLSENTIDHDIKGLFLIATPFWSGDEDWKQGLILQEDFADKIPTTIPLYLYHSQDDEVAPIEQLAHYTAAFPHATVRQAKEGGHQLNDDLQVVAEDIRSL